MSDEDDSDETPDEILKRSAPPKAIIGGGIPHSDARCPECGVVVGREHLEGCKYA